MTHKTQLRSTMLFSSQVRHRDGAMSAGPSWGPLPCSTATLCASQPRWEPAGSRGGWQKLGSRGFFCPSEQEMSCLLAGKMGERCSYFYFFKSRAASFPLCAWARTRSGLCRGSLKIPGGFLLFVSHVLPLLLGRPGDSESNLQPQLSHYLRCHDG